MSDPWDPVTLNGAASNGGWDAGLAALISRPPVRMGLGELWRTGVVKATDLNWYELELVTQGQGADQLASWQPLDLAPYFRGEVKRAEPSIGWPRADGMKLLYPGKEHSILGEMESGKSWFLCACAMSELTNGNRVIYVHFEEADPTDTIERLLALGASPSQIENEFAFVAPAERASLERIAALLDPAPTLVILDGVNEALALHGLEINQPDGIAEYRRLIVKPCKASGAAVISADHVAKAVEGRGRTAIGSVHKGNAIDGASFLLENSEPFGRGMKGASALHVVKDRPGHLRSRGRPDAKMPGKTYLGHLVVDDTRTWRDYLDLVILAPQEAVAEGVADETAVTKRDADEQAILDTIRRLANQEQSTVEKSILAETRGISRERKTDALTRLVNRGEVLLVRGARKAKVYSLPEPLKVVEEAAS